MEIPVGDNLDLAGLQGPEHRYVRSLRNEGDPAQWEPVVGGAAEHHLLVPGQDGGGHCCYAMDVLHLDGQVSDDRSSVTLSEAPGKEYFRNHRDRYVQLPIRVMIRNRITGSLMITILTNPEQVVSSRRRKHTVKKFQVPGYVTELLEGLPFVVGFGIRGDVLMIEDTFSLLVGLDLKLSGFFELGSLCLYAGWG